MPPLNITAPSAAGVATGVTAGGLLALHCGCHGDEVIAEVVLAATAVPCVMAGGLVVLQ